MKNYRHRKRRKINFKGLKHKYGNIYEDEEGDEFKRIGKRKFLRMTDIQMGWSRLSKRQIRERIKTQHINKIINIVFWIIIIFIIYLILKKFS